jgi:hypothetical protein
MFAAEKSASRNIGAPLNAYDFLIFTAEDAEM